MQKIIGKSNVDDNLDEKRHVATAVILLREEEGVGKAVDNKMKS